MSLTLMVAMSENRVIGRNNELPWKISADLKRFKELTTGKVVVMGRKTWDSLPKKPLPNRHNWVLSRRHTQLLSGAHMLEYPGQAIEAAKDQDVIVIGGAEIYEIFFPFANIIEMTLVHAHIPDGDTFFPEFHENEWDTVSEVRHSKDEKNEYDYTFLTLKRFD